MTECNQSSFGFEACGRREIVARFDGGTVSSDGGAFLLRQTDKRLNLLPQGTLAIHIVAQGTGLFMGMIGGGLAVRATLGIKTMMQSGPEGKAWSEYVVDAFLKMLR
jgi:hypothetical protein